MIVLDTDVLSETMAVRPSPVVRDWLDRQNSDDIWITAVTLYEVELGIELLPLGKKRRQIEGTLFHVLVGLIRGRVLPLADAAANATAALTVKRRRAGRPIELADALIAGIVKVNSATLATRNVRDFTGTGITVVNPWESD